MNILIVGNGFDLSHYLPTKYDHFMVAMKAIVDSDDFTDEMNFDEIFGKLYSQEKGFFGFTKSIYRAESIKINNLNNIRERLKENVWYNYFSNYKSRIDTWIDFEKSIEKALQNLSMLITKYEELKHKVTLIDNCISEMVSEDGNTIVLPDYISEQLESLGVLVSYEGVNQFNWVNGYPDKLWKFNSCYMVGDENSYDESEIILELKCQDILKDLCDQLDEFSNLFSFYLSEIVQKLRPRKKIKKLNIDSNVEIYSFNYTNTAVDIHSMQNQISFLHGNLSKQNIVLGIVEIPEVLKKFKSFAFAKYAQKIIKDTDYNYLDDSKVLSEILENHKYDEPQHYIDEDELKIIIWGHSLDISDSDYIIQLFDLEKKKGVRPIIHIYHHNESAKKDMLFNLYTIIDQRIVNRWIMKKWLQFLPNPNLVEINQIQPVELPELDYF